MSVSFSETVSTAGQSALTAKGDILVHNGTSPARVAVGSNGSFLATGSVAGAYWTSISGGTSGYELIATTTVTTAISSVTFSSISSSYKALVLRGIARTHGGDSAFIRIGTTTNTAILYDSFTHTSKYTGSTSKTGELNNDISSGFKIRGSASSAARANFFGSFTLLITQPNATATNSSNRTFLWNAIGFEAPAGATDQDTHWESGGGGPNSAVAHTDVVNYLSIRADFNSHAIGSRFSLYGLK